MYNTSQPPLNATVSQVYNSDQPPLIPAHPRADVIGDMAYYIAEVIFRVVLDPALSVSSLISNIINVLVFCRMDLRNGVTATFLVLSISDGLLGFTGLIEGISSIIRYLELPKFRQTAGIIYFFMFAALTMLNLVSTYATLVLAVARCCGVVMPLKVKVVMTTRRQLMSILALSLPSVAVAVYGVSFYRFSYRMNSVTNTTQLVVSFTPDFRQRVRVSDQFRCVVFFLSFTIINVCLVILIVALKRSSSFVAQATQFTAGSKDVKSTALEVAAKARRRESQVIKTIILVSAVFTVTNLPLMIMSISRQTIPGFTHSGHLRKWFNIFFLFCIAMGFVNSSVNIFVYLHCNTKYRETFKGLFSSVKKREASLKKKMASMEQ